jgi:hypothetical protein
MTSEQAIQSQILVAIGALDGVLVWRQNVGKAPSAWKRVGGFAAARLRGLLSIDDPRPLYVSSGRLVQYGAPGQPDIMAIAAGRFVGIEVKTEIGRQSANQKIWQAAIEAAGGVYVLARSVSDATRAVEEVRRG